MRICSLLLIAVVCFQLTMAARWASAAGGTSNVATKGSDAHINDGWPNGTAALVNHPLRTDGWNSWFTEWPNDVNQYAFEITSTDDVNKLIELLAAIESPIKQVRLSPNKEPATLGWVTRLDEGNGIAAIFSIGDQARVDQWYAHVRKPFGKMNFKDVPVAVPPTLTIYVQSERVKLDDLKIPDGVVVAIGEAPTVFHKMNLVDEPEPVKVDVASKPLSSIYPAELRPTAEAIEKFLKQRESEQ